MTILVYTALILCIGLANKFVQSLSGEYAVSDLIADLPIIVLTYFGLVALWGRARHKRYLSEAFWRAYFVVIMASVVLLPLFDQSIRSIMNDFGVFTGIAAYSVMVILLVPYYWALYAYAYGRSRVWISS